MMDIETYTSPVSLTPRLYHYTLSIRHLHERANCLRSFMLLLHRHNVYFSVQLRVFNINWIGICLFDVLVYCTSNFTAQPFLPLKWFGFSPFLSVLIVHRYNTISNILVACASIIYHGITILLIQTIHFALLKS